METKSTYKGFVLVSRRDLTEHTVEITTEILGLMAKLQGAFGFGPAICRGQSQQSAMAAARQLIDELLAQERHLAIEAILAGGPLK
jgi:hypothetical protein